MISRAETTLGNWKPVYLIYQHIHQEIKIYIIWSKLFTKGILFLMNIIISHHTHQKCINQKHSFLIVCAFSITIRTEMLLDDRGCWLNIFPVIIYLFIKYLTYWYRALLRLVMEYNFHKCNTTYAAYALISDISYFHIWSRMGANNGWNIYKLIENTLWYVIRLPRHMI